MTLERFLVLILAIWGAVLLLPTDLFGGPAAELYDPMGHFAPEWLWGAAALGLGLAQLVGMELRRRRGWELVRTHVLALATMAAFYAFLAVMFAQVDVWLVGPWLYAAFAGATLTVIWELRP